MYTFAEALKPFELLIVALTVTLLNAVPTPWFQLT
jgi:hypothetical protein